MGWIVNGGKEGGTGHRIVADAQHSCCSVMCSVGALLCFPTCAWYSAVLAVRVEGATQTPE